MTKHNIIGREEELKILDEVKKSQEAEFVAIIVGVRKRFYNRFFSYFIRLPTKRIHLEPFNLRATEKFLKSRSVKLTIDPVK